MRPSIYETAGGEPAFLALAAAHHQGSVDDPELTMEWAVADVLERGDPEAVVPEGRSVPHWSWEGLAT